MLNYLCVKSRAISIAALGCVGSMVLLAAPALASGTADFGECKISENAPQHALDPLRPGVLTVDVPLPAPGWFNGNTVETIKSGYGYCMLASIAHRGGLERIELNQTSFEALITAKGDKFDMTQWEIAITPEREAVVDFSIPYGSARQAVMVRKGSDVTRENISEKKIGILIGSVAQRIVDDVIKPSRRVQVFQDPSDMTAALLSRVIEVAINDDTALLEEFANKQDMLEVIGRFSQFESEMGILLPKNSVNTEIVNNILRDMEEDGTLEQLREIWLTPLFAGVDPEDLPEWK